MTHLHGRGALRALLMSAALSGCHAKSAVCNAPQDDDAAVQRLAQSDTAFALSFYAPATAAVGAEKNVILSPYGVSAVMTMLDVGAAGETATQIQEVLHLPSGGAATAPGYAALACAEETNGSADDNQIAIANALWGQQGMSFQPSFLSVLAGGYSAPLQQVDFQNDVGGATDTINAWVSGRTQGKIPTLFQPGDLGASTRLVVTDAIYFNGRWAQGFSADRTTAQPFTLGDGTMVDVPTMKGTVDVTSAAGQGFSVVELPYQGGAMVMDFLLPDVALADLESSLTADGLKAALSSLAPSRAADVSLPKFQFSTRAVLTPVLAGMGMSDVFSPTLSDLSGIDGKKDLYVDLVVQQAFVEVDEQGTVAAAATGAVSDAYAGSLPTYISIDHPFLFLIRDTRTGSILFMGHVQDPRAGS